MACRRARRRARAGARQRCIGCHRRSARGRHHARAARRELHALRREVDGRMAHARRAARRSATRSSIASHVSVRRVSRHRRCSGDAGAARAQVYGLEYRGTGTAGRGIRGIRGTARTVMRRECAAGTGDLQADTDGCPKTNSRRSLHSAFRHMPFRAVSVDSADTALTERPHSARREVT